jgi:hypothetical protein
VVILRGSSDAGWEGFYSREEGGGVGIGYLISAQAVNSPYCI